MEFNIDDVAAKIRFGPFSIEVKRGADKPVINQETDELLEKRKWYQDKIDEIDKQLGEKGAD